MSREVIEMHPTIALFERNQWANERLVEFCAQLPAEVLSAASGDDVLGPVDVALPHIVSGETVVLPWVTGQRISDELVADLTMRNLQPVMAWSAEQWPRAVDFDRDPEAVYPFQGRTRTVEMTSWLGLLQFVHHGDDHRNQIATMLSRHGVQPPDLDLWAFVEATGREYADASAGRPDRRDAILRRAFGHHAWATEKLLADCMQLSAEQLALTAPGTYGSILDTLDHMISADRSYLSRLQGSGRKPPLEAGALAPLREEFMRAADGWLAHLDSHPDFEAPGDMRDGTKIGAWAIVAQAIHHGNDHRTHVTTTMMHNGLPVPDLDAWEYAKAVMAPASS